MSIDAKIINVYGYLDGTMGFDLGPREPGGRPGQFTLEIINPPPQIDYLQPFVGREIWGTDAVLMLGNTVIAEREGYLGIRLVDGWMNILNGETSNV